MEEQTSGIYGKPNFNLIVGLFAVTILVVLVGALFYFRYGHHFMHTTPQPKNNKGMLMEPFW